MTTFGDMVYQMGGAPVGLGASVPFSTGTYFFVDSATGNNGNSGRKPDQALATIDAAVGKCTANKGDVIIVMPNHTENLGSAGALTLDVAGITAVGLGSGAQTPTLIHTADGADIDISAADVTLRNLEIQSNTADVTASIDLDATGCWLDGITWREGSALCFLDVIVGGADNACDDLKITNCKSFQGDAANDGFLNCVGDIDGLIFQNNNINRTVAAGTEPVVEVTGKSLTNCLITGNRIFGANISGITFIDSDQVDNSGIVAYNSIFSLDSDAATPFNITGAGLFENYALGAVDGSGLLLPAVDDNA